MERRELGRIFFRGRVQSPGRCHFQVSTNSFQSPSTRIPAADCSIDGRATAWSGRCEKSSSIFGESIEITLSFFFFSSFYELHPSILPSFLPSFSLFILSHLRTAIRSPPFAASSRDLIRDIEGDRWRNDKLVDRFCRRPTTTMFTRASNLGSRGKVIFSCPLFLLLFLPLSLSLSRNDRWFFIIILIDQVSIIFDIIHFHFVRYLFYC